MKTKIIGQEKEIELPEVFETPIRQDIIKKVYLATLKKQPYGTYPLAGKSSSPHKQSHARRKFKTLYGKGISRVPRKTLSRRGDQFYWVGTFIPGTVKGRAPHPPRPVKKKRSINKKEKLFALKSCIAATASVKLIKENYKKFPSEKINLPLVIESSLLNKKIKEIISFLKQHKIELEKEKAVRAGKGKSRGRKYKNKGKMLLIIGEKENLKNLRGIFNIQKISRLSINDLSLNGKPGKLVIYTDTAIKEISNRFQIKNK